MKHLLAALALVVLLSPQAQATVVRGFTLPQLYREADGIYLGKVTQQRSFWNEGHDTIYTEFTIAVEKTEKGQERQTTVVRIMGGSVGDVRLSVAGNATFEIGERVLVAVRDQGTFVTLVGMAQGKWSVHSRDGRDVVTRGTVPTSSGPTVSPETTLDDLLKQLRKGGPTQ